jgi:hypothetical protein
VTVVTRSCSRCGNPSGATALAAGLCPACLLAAALADDDDACPYRVVAPMAEGRQGITYLAQALRGGRRYVALKVFDRHDDVSGALARFERWKPLMDAVPHASLARLIDAGRTSEGFLYVATEFVAGWPLTASRTLALDRQVRQTLAWQLADAVATAHAAGAPHLALTTARVKVSTAGGPRATILGWGVRLVVDEVEPACDADLAALLALVRELGVAPPDGPYPTAAALARALVAGL